MTAAPVSRTRRNCAIVAFALAIICALAALFAPGTAYAKTFACPSVNVNAAVQTDGSIDVTETRTFDFDGRFTAVWWNFESLPSEACEVAVSSVAVTDDATGETQQLSETTFQRSWRDSTDATQTAYAYDETGKTLYVFFEASDASYTVTLTYSISNYVQVYDDVAEVYWRYVSSGWSVPSEHVTATLILPVGSSSDDETTMRAWTRGQKGTGVTLAEDGTVTCQVSQVASGSYAETHITMPKSWMSSVRGTDVNRHMGNRLQSAIDEEEQNAQSDNANRLQQLTHIVVCLVLALALVLWAVIAFWRHGRDRKPQLPGDGLLAAALPEAHPLAIGRLWRWNAESPADITAQLAQLQAVGALRVDEGSYVPQAGSLAALRLTGEPTSDPDIGSAEGASAESSANAENAAPGAEASVQDVYLTKLPGWDAANADPIDAAAMHLIFDVAGQGASQVWLSGVEQFAHDNPQEFHRAWAAWQQTVDKQVDECGFFEKKSQYYQIAAWVVGFIAAIVAVLGIVQADPVRAIAFALAAVVLFVTGAFMRRHSESGATASAQCEAYRTRVLADQQESASAYAAALDVPEGGAAAGVIADAAERIYAHRPRALHILRGL